MTTTAQTLRRWDGGRPMVAREINIWWWPRWGEDRLLRALTAMAVFSLLMPVLVTGIIGAALLSPPLSGSLPPLLPGIDSQTTRVYDANGAEIATLGRFESTVAVAAGDIPAVLRQAVVAAEDKRFYSHGGVDSRSILRALWVDIRGMGYHEGASTITEQYVRLAYNGDRRTLGRKVTEAVLARRVEAVLSKDEILYRYLSRAYFGGGAYGVGAAAESYFHKSVRDLTLSEAALLAGLLPAPSRYEPRAHPYEAEAQRISVLAKMQGQGRFSAEEIANAAAQRVVLAGAGTRVDNPATIVYPPESPKATPYPWFVDYVSRYLVARYGDEAVYEHGLRVQTSLDPGLQAKAEASVASALEGTQAPLDMAMVVLDPTTGLVRAMVGGRDFASSQVNLALGACPQVGGKPADGGPLCISGGGSGRQPGSAFKPFTLAKAFEKGFRVDRTYPGPASYNFPQCRGTSCTVRNVESGSFGTITLRQATAYSVNTVYAQLVADVGVTDTAELAHRLGLTSINPDGALAGGEPYGPSLTLGAAEVSPLDMAAAYGVFAARGVQRAASPVIKVTGRDGSVLEASSARPDKRVLATDVADRVNDVLKDVVGYGTGRAADIGRPDGTAGKTGTSEGHGDAWFVGYTPALVTSVWMGYADSRKPLVNIKGVAKVYGGTLPAQAWHDFMAAAAAGTPAQSFGPPPPPPFTPSPAPRAISVPPMTEAPYTSPVPPTEAPYTPPEPGPYEPPPPVVTMLAPVPTTSPVSSCLLCLVAPR